MCRQRADPAKGGALALAPRNARGEVEGADEVIVTLTDRREFRAKVLGSDSKTDVAVLKIEATGLTGPASEVSAWAKRPSPSTAGRTTA